MVTGEQNTPCGITARQPSKTKWFLRNGEITSDCDFSKMEKSQAASPTMEAPLARSASRGGRGYLIGRFSNPLVGFRESGNGVWGFWGGRVRNGVWGF